MTKNLPCLLAFVTVFAAGCASTTAEGQRVRVAKSPDELFGCEAKGSVTAKGMANLDAAMNSVRNKAAVLGANVIEVTNENAFWGAVEANAFNCDPAATRARDNALVEAANRAITCVQGNDCEYRWSRAMEWVQAHSSWKFRTVTDTLLTTEGPLETARPAFEVAKLSQGDGRNYRITFRAWCGVGNCEGLIVRLHGDFNAFVTRPPGS